MAHALHLFQSKDFSLINLVIFGYAPLVFPMPSLGALRNASSAIASAAARADDQLGRRDAQRHAILIRAASAYSARPRMQQGSNALAPPSRPSIPPPTPQCECGCICPPPCSSDQPLALRTNGITKDEWAKEEKDGVGYDGDQAQHNMTQHKRLANVPYFMNMSEWQENNKKAN
jgi:hypothetical protein